jgi:hypothetical protein
MKGPRLLLSLALFLTLLPASYPLKAQETREEWVRTTALLSSKKIAEGSYRVLITYEISGKAAHNYTGKNPITHYLVSDHPVNKIVAIEYRQDEPIIFHCMEKNCLQ